MPSRRQNRLLFGNQNPILNYLLKVGFSTPDSTPFNAAPYAGELGYVLGVDASSHAAAANGIFTYSGSTDVAGCGVISAAVGGAAAKIVRAAGRIFSLKVPATRTLGSTGDVIFGFSVSDIATNAVNYGFGISNTTINVRNIAALVSSPTIGSAPANDIVMFFIMRSSGALILFKDGSNDPVLAWVYNVLNSDMYAKGERTGSGSTRTFSMDDWNIYDHPSFVNDFATASVHKDPPVASASYAAQSDGFNQLSFTLPGSPSANMVAVEMRYRISGASTYATVYIKRNAGNTAWDLLSDSVNAGTPTNRLTVTGIGNPTRIGVSCRVQSQTVFTEESGVLTTQTAFTHNIGLNFAPIMALWDAATTIGVLDSFPTSHPLYNRLPLAA